MYRKPKVVPGRPMQVTPSQTQKGVPGERIAPIPVQTTVPSAPVKIHPQRRDTSLQQPPVNVSDYMLPDTQPQHTVPNRYYPPEEIALEQVMEVERILYDPKIDINSPLDVELDYVEEEYRPPTKEDLQQPIPLSDLVKEGKLMHKQQPCQRDINALMKHLNRKLLRQVHLPTSFRDMQGAYLNSPHFRDVYLYLMQNRVPANARKRSRVNALSSDYFLMDCLLFKIGKDKITGEYKPLLCIPTSKVDMLLNYFHSSLMGGHMGMTKTYLTISQQFFCPNLAHHVRAYIIGCHVCQMVKSGKKIQRPLQKRINIGVPALCKVSMDIKHMPPTLGRKPRHFILVLLCEVSNFMVVKALKAVKSTDICTAICKCFIKTFGPPTHIICDQDPAFMSALTQNFFRMFGIRILTVGPTNHKSLLAEHGIKSLAEILKCHLAEFGPTWMTYLDFAMLAYNSYSTPNLDGLCPFELVFGRKPNVLPLQEAMPKVPITGTHKQYYEQLCSRLEYLRRHLVKF